MQDAADFVGDSLELARKAAADRRPVILFCGVHFMAETANILSPAEDRAHARHARRLPDGRHGHGRRSAQPQGASTPTRSVVAYVNTSADIKAESDVCCTSANASRRRGRYPQDRATIIFVPDRNLGD